ncbi:hypothetical protein ACFL4C_04650 [Candidatus Omnitrophota bacterium]
MAERKGRYIIESKDIPTERNNIPELAVEERVKNFNEVELGYNREQAVAEATRCLSCRRCIGCGLCLAVCKPQAIDYAQVDSEIELDADSIIITLGVERIPSNIEGKFGYGKYINVVTFPEFERILSDNGLHKGLLLRPYDGEIPQKIAFIPGDAYQSTQSLSYALKAILAAQRKVQGLESHLFFPDAETHLSEIKRYLGKESKANVSTGEVLAVIEGKDTSNLIVEFVQSNKTRKEEFELVVLLTTFELPDDIKELTKILELDFASYRFQETVDTSLVKTAKDGILLSGMAFTKQP